MLLAMSQHTSPYLLLMSLEILEWWQTGFDKLCAAQFAYGTKNGWGDASTALSPRKSQHLASPRIGAKGRQGRGRGRGHRAQPVKGLQKKFVEAVGVCNVAGSACEDLAELLAAHAPNSFAVDAVKLNAELLKKAGAAFFASLRAAAADLNIEEDDDDMSPQRVCYTSHF